MGEELLAICVHWLSRIRDAQSYKYIIFTDDKKSMNIFGKVIKNVHDYAGSNSISVFTTVKLCYIMRLKGIVDCEEQIVRMLEVSGFDDIVKVYCSEEFELAPTEKRMQIEEFAKKVMDGNTKIYY